MIVLAGLVIGALIGAQNARKRKGSRADIAQYAAVGGIIGALVGLFVTIGVERMF